MRAAMRGPGHEAVPLPNSSVEGVRDALFPVARHVADLSYYIQVGTSIRITGMSSRSDGITFMGRVQDNGGFGPEVHIMGTAIGVRVDTMLLNMADDVPPPGHRSSAPFPAPRHGSMRSEPY